MVPTLLKSLRIDPQVLLFNGVLFLALLAILDRIFWKPMMRHLDDRRQGIKAAFTAVDEARREMENLRAEYQGRLAQIEAEARGRIQATVRDAQKEREEIIAVARADFEETVHLGEDSIRQEMALAALSMRGGLDEVALEVLQKATGARPDSAQRKLVEEYIAQRVLQS